MGKLVHKLFFYPVNNGDSCQIVLENKRRILLDYRQYPNSEDSDAKTIDLAKQLKSDLDAAGRDYFDVVAFTHADKDHIEGSTEFFHLDHASKYQGDQRVKVNELWVPAAMVLESASNDEQSEEFVILRQEARHRLKKGEGIKIFSKPQEMIELMEKMDLNPSDYDHIFVDAGTLVDTFNLTEDQVEFFCHSPFIKHLEDGGKEVRNKAALIFNVRFSSSGGQYDFMAIGDSEYEVLEDIVSISTNHDNKDRLGWNILKATHHCSYKALSDEKGETETVPTDGVKDLLLAGKKDSYIVSSSKEIPSNSEAYESVQPPHIQARKCYERYLDEVGGRKFLVTMEEPSSDSPKPLEFTIGALGISWNKPVLSAATIITSTKPARAG